ncbi:Insulin-like growth factor-binding protein complex acid labile subunit, partial [Stegodyphus mimosarum]
MGMDQAYFCILLGFLLWICNQTMVSARCPKSCTCALKSGKKSVFCSTGGLTLIPVSEMDVNTHELIVTAPPDNPNNITIGRIFLKFTNLETVRITYSSLPAIGDSSFWPGRRMHILDLSNNAISFLRESDFNGLKSLQELDLSDNQIFATPSAPFRHLINLQKLSLARNRLQTLVPRFFYLLTHLEELDLSGNALEQIEPEILQDVKELKVLKLASCRLTHLHPIIYQQLSHLEHLDLRDNLIASLAPAEFRHLSRLTILNLDGNLLSGIPEGTFHGHKMRLLSISRNNLSSLSDYAFTNTSVKELDVSHNRLEYVLKETFEPLSESLEFLNISFNDVGNQAFSSIVTPLRNLLSLRASNILITNLTPGIFSHNVNMKSLNLSRNSLSELSSEFLIPLENLEELDLTYNLLATVSRDFLEGLANITSIKTLLLYGNPFDCSSCLIEHLLQWMNESELMMHNCSEDTCLRCLYPQDRMGQFIHTISPKELFCHSGVYDRHYLVYTSQVGLIVAVSIIVVIVCIILVIIIIYRRHIAHYYTHEEERRAWKGIYENPALAPSGGVHYSDDKPTFISTPDKVDENIDDFRRPSSIMR